MRRPSLVEEIQGRDPEYAQHRINEALNNLSLNERNEVMSDYHKKSVQVKDKQSYLARLIDAFFDRKETKKPTGNSLRQSIGSISAPTQLPATATTDNRVADYVFIKTLGKGTFGKVKLAEHILTKERVAIKIIEKANIKTSKQKISVDREVRLMKLLHHPHIVGVVDVYENKDYIWIVMENASGGELFDYIVKNGTVKELEARKFFRQILSAVEYCHQNSIIHRDLKPENLLLDQQHNIKIIDFGFGNTFHRDRLLDTYCGSPFYAAPEMIRGIRYIGPEVDVWSLGVILYALLSGRLPFDAATVNELYEKIAKGRYTCPPHFSPQASHLIARMLTTDPTKRATLQEIRQHPWVNEGYTECIRSYVMERPLTIANPNTDSLRELVSYGFREDEVTRILRTEMNLHPIVSLYHLIDEARERKEKVFAELTTCDDINLKTERTNSLATIGTDRSNSISTESGKAVSDSELMDIQAPSEKAKRTTRYFPRIYKTKRAESDVLSSDEVEMPQAALSARRRSSVPVGEQCATQSYRSQRRSASGENGVNANYGAPEPQQPSQQPRPVRGLFNYQVSSEKAFFEICCEIERVLTIHCIPTEKKAQVYLCNDAGHRFEIEIRKDDTKQKNSHDIFFRKIQGTYWNHKSVCNKLLKDMRL